MFSWSSFDRSSLFQVVWQLGVGLPMLRILGEVSVSICRGVAAAGGEPPGNIDLHGGRWGCAASLALVSSPGSRYLTRRG